MTIFSSHRLPYYRKLILHEVKTNWPARAHTYISGGPKGGHEPPRKNDLPPPFDLCLAPPLTYIR